MRRLCFAIKFIVADDVRLRHASTAVNQTKLWLTENGDIDLRGIFAMQTDAGDGRRWTMMRLSPEV